METNETTLTAEMFSNSSDFDPNGGSETKEAEFDIFAGWDDSAAETTEEAPAEEEQTAPTTEQPTEEAPTTEQPETKKLNFKAKIDHQEQDISIDETELPVLYQKAQNADRAARRADEAKAAADGYKAYMNKMAQVAKIMNFDGKTTEEQLDAFYDGMITTAKQSKVKELVEAGTAQTVAEFVVEQQMKDAGNGMAQTEVSDDSTDSGDALQHQPPTPEQFQNDLNALFKEFPDAMNEEFPKAVMDAYIRGENLTYAYMKHRINNPAAEKETQKLKEQNDILQQNQASAAKAPIHKGVSSGAGKQTADNPLLAGFDDKGW